MPSKTDLGRKIAQASTLKGTFTLRSGQVSSRYFDKYRFEGDPVLLGELAETMIDLLPRDTEVLAGLELGGVPLATAMSLKTGLLVAFVRKEAKAYGTCRAVEGTEINRKRVTFVEDVITTGGAVADAHNLLHDEDAIILAVVCAIWRGEGEPSIASLPDLRVLPALSLSDLEN